MPKLKSHKLTRRERQIISIIHRLESASVQDVIDNMENPPSYSAIRALMRIMEERGYLKHKKQGAKYIYSTTESKKSSAKTAIKNIVKTYFDDSPKDAVMALLDTTDVSLSKADLKRISKIIGH